MADLLPTFMLIEPPLPKYSDIPGAWPATIQGCWKREVENLGSEELRGHFASIKADLRNLAKLEDGKRPEYDCLVSPANSFGIMDGGYDLALSYAIQLDGDLSTLTTLAQSAIKARYRGYAPPGTCTLVPFPSGLTSSTRSPTTLNPFSTKIMAVVPTMRKPEDVSWAKDLVYDSTWSILLEVTKWNEAHPTKEEGKIESVLLTGLGTGTGQISAERFTKQWFLAVKHFVEGWADTPDWRNVGAKSLAIVKSREL